MTIINDTRGAIWTLSTQLILEGETNIGVDEQGYPKFAYYKVPSIQITRNRKVLMDEYDIFLLSNEIDRNADVFEGSEILKSFSMSGNAIYIDGKPKYPATLTYIDYPPIDTDWNPPEAEVTKQVLTSVLGYDSANNPYGGGEYKGLRVTEKITELASNSIPTQGLDGDKIITSVKTSNYKVINDDLYRDTIIEYREFP